MPTHLSIIITCNTQHSGEVHAFGSAGLLATHQPCLETQEEDSGSVPLTMQMPAAGVPTRGLHHEAAITPVTLHTGFAAGFLRLKTATDFISLRNGFVLMTIQAFAQVLILDVQKRR